jgi:hypothetical protein
MRTGPRLYARRASAQGLAGTIHNSQFTIHHSNRT